MVQIRHKFKQSARLEGMSFFSKQGMARVGELVSVHACRFGVEVSTYTTFV